MGTLGLRGEKEACRRKMLLYRLSVASLLLVLMSSLPACACHRLSRSPLPGSDDCFCNETRPVMTAEHEGNESVRNKTSPGSTEEPVNNQSTSISTVSTEDSNSPSPTEASVRSKRNSVSTEDSLRNKRSPSSTEEAVRYKRSPVLSTEDTNRKKRSSSDEHGDEPHPHLT